MYFDYLNKNINLILKYKDSLTNVISNKMFKIKFSVL